MTSVPTRPIPVPAFDPTRPEAVAMVDPRSGALSRSLVATLGVAGAAMAAADGLNPQYNPLSEVASRYVNGTAGWLITVALLGIGTASAVLAGWLGRLPELGRAGRIGRWALMLWAVGVFVAGVFPADPPGQWSRPSTSELVHGMAAWLSFAAFPVAAVLLTRAVTRGGTRPAVVVPGRLRSGLVGLVIASVVSTIGLAVFLVDVMGGPSLGFGGVPTFVGLVERLVIVANLAWLALAAVMLGGMMRNGAGRPEVSRVQGGTDAPA